METINGSPAIRRSFGVTAIAVLSLLGSLLTLVFGITMALGLLLFPLRATRELSSPQVFRAILVLGTLIYLLPAIWGLASSIGLFRLRNWARISTIVSSVLLILMGAFGGLGALVLLISSRTNGGLGGQLPAVAQAVMAVFYLALISIGAWWIVFLTRQAVREQFIQLVRADSAARSYQDPQPVLRPQAAIPAGTPGEMQPPVSITVIGCLLLAGCFFMIWGVVLRTPVVLFTNELTGSAAVAFCLTSIALHVYIGIGLLRLRRAARMMGIACFLSWMLSSAVFYFAPGGHDHLVSLITKQQSVFPWMQDWQNQPSFQLDFTHCYSLVLS